jgi:hypothetical protein
VMSWQPRRYHEGGYLVIDHRASPGMTAEEARLIGFNPNEVKEGCILERSTLTCSHCGTAVIKNPDRVRPRENCSKCNHYICDGCYTKMQLPDYVHIPFVALIDLMR